MLSIEEARQRILVHAHRLSTEEVSLLEAGGRVFREKLAAPRDFPPFSTAAMDGYALSAEDVLDATRERPVRLRVDGEVAASDWREQPVPRGTCVRIFTGAAVPPGVDAVIMQEEVSRVGDEAVFTTPVAVGNSIRQRGEDLRQGAPLLEPLTVLRPGELGLLASIGRSVVRVTRKPRVAILSCGDELVPLHATPRPGQIYESNRYALASLVRQNGGEPLLLPLTPDQPEMLEEQIRAGLRADVLISSGGVSVGEHDWVRPALQAAGVELHLWRVAVKPGKPLVFGKRDDTLFFGLPGNPASALVTFALFVRPALRKLQGKKELYRQALRASLVAPTRGTRGRTHLVRGRLQCSPESIGFEPVTSQSSGNLLSLHEINALGILPPGPRRFERGEEILVLPLGGALEGEESAFAPDL